MTVLREGALELTLPNGVQGKKFDGPSHGLSHCMKAVDFILEEPDRILFVELKDPDHPHANSRNRKAFRNQLYSGVIVGDLVGKFRDSFIYRWAESAPDKPRGYYVLLAASELDKAMLLILTEELKRNLPVEGSTPGTWKRQMAAHCGVFNLATWNEHLPEYSVKRVVDDQKGS
ncbi:MAG TPA: hypothetical protein P5560_10040 [Thermotogota bacterium]|nr:hypothetical protein [Thermotogota bacterium]HRW93275.1 hypothetical protein [Thermotogota bacterium]